VMGDGDAENPKVVVVGDRGVGKSALTVRFLTKRFIGEYQESKATLYYKSMDIYGWQVGVEMLDTDCQVVTLAPHQILLVLYSITDEASFHTASSILSRAVITDSNQVFLLGNKLDLNHFREVDLCFCT